MPPTLEVRPEPRHTALLYRSDAELLAGVVPFLRDGLERDDAVAANFDRDTIAVLHDALGDDARHVTFTDIRAIGGNPARLSAMWFGFLIEQAELGRAVCGAGEPVWAGRSEAEHVEAGLHDALVNLRLPGVPVPDVLCPYDAAALGPQPLADALTTHPVVLGSEQHGHDPAHAESVFRTPLDDPPAGAVTVAYDLRSLPHLREAVGRCALAAGLASVATEDLVLAVNEAATNSLRYGGGCGTLGLWSSTEGVHAQVSDAGVIASPLAGRLPPSPEPVHGRGLWIINQLCDLVQLRSGPSFGTTVRLTQRHR